jgi:methionyl-tRNA formyltransferase
LVDAVDAIADGRQEETAQDESLATYAHKLEKSDGVVDWTRSAREIQDQIRALHPWPHAYADLEGERTILLHSSVVHGNESPNTPPGTVVEAQGDRFSVQTGSGVLRLLTLQREGRAPVSARAFLAGRRIQAGIRFSAPQPPS